MSGTKEGSSSWFGFMPGQRPRRSCEKYNVEKHRSEPGIRARGDHESVTPLPTSSEKEEEAGFWIGKDPSSRNLTNLQDFVSTSSSAIPAADEQ